MKTSQAKIDMERVWLNQLQSDFRSICWNYKIKLKTPIIQLSNSKNQMGSWDSFNKTIKISSHFIKEYNWDIIKNVLKHEMAHIISEDYLDAYPGHNNEFHQACNIIGVPDEYRSANSDIELIKAQQKNNSSSTTNRILEKVKKLMALAGSSNEHESFLAMKKANELMIKYNIGRFENNTQDRYTYKIICHKKKRVENYQRRICTIIWKYFFVEVVFSSLFDAKKGETYKSIEFLGTDENVKMAEYVYYFLLNNLESLWKVYNEATNVGYKHKRSYWLGILDGFSKKMELIDNSELLNKKNYTDLKTNNIGALIRQNDDILKEFISLRFPRLKSYRANASTVFYTAFNDGVEEGKKLNISRGIDSKVNFRGKLLN